jgi:hypothetical protein
VNPRDTNNKGVARTAGARTLHDEIRTTTRPFSANFETCPVGVSLNFEPERGPATACKNSKAWYSLSQQGRAKSARVAHHPFQQAKIAWLRTYCRGYPS